MLMSVMVAVIFETYKRLHSQLIINEREFQRKALVAAFALLDMDGDGMLSKREYFALMIVACPARPKAHWQLIFEANVRQQQKDEFARLFPGRKVPKQWFEKCPWRQILYQMGRLHTGHVDPDYISRARPNAVRKAEEKRLEAEANERMGLSGGDANKVYKVGDLVEAKKDGQGDWLAGTVDDVTDGKKGKTYLVVFADGGQDPEAKAANMKPR